VNPALLVGLFASVLFGAADFTGGIAARRAPALLVTCFSGLGALLVLFLGMPFTHGAPTTRDLAWGAAGGVFGAAGATLIYKSLALGPVSVASPVFCVVGLTVPVLFGVATGERPSWLAWAGVALAVLSIPLVARAREDRSGYTRTHIRRTLFVATMAGLVVGWFLIAVAQIRGGAGLWPLVVARSTGVVVLAVGLLARRSPLVPPAPARFVALGAGALDSSANVAYWFAVQSAPIALVGTLVSLAPATTVLLARLVLGERMATPQRWGLGLALLAGALISSG